MAMCLVLCLLVLLQTSLLVLGEETTTKLDTSNSESETTSKMQQTEPLADEPTRLPSKIPTTMPPLDHSKTRNVTAIANAAIDTIKNSTKSMNSSSSEEKTKNPEKAGAASLFSSIQIVIVSVIGVFLSASAI